MILYINACVREESRTKRLADKLLSTLGSDIVQQAQDLVDQLNQAQQNAAQEP